MANLNKKTLDYATALARCMCCVRGGCNQHWIDIHEKDIENMMDEAPSGSGFDNGTSIDYDEWKPNRLVFNTAFHHISEHGYYIKWTEHKVIVTPCFKFGFDIKVTGRNYRGIKDYIGDCFNHWLMKEIERC